ncbi:MAG: hypothetical protein JST00_01345 [Deltaproteobacteria bacterium]|nr:hypothetical protein [Deltaproteobacteria bacterium]
MCTPKGTLAFSARNPVCGCDNVTYWNAQVADAFGANVRAGSGACNDIVAARCNGIANLKCPEKRDCNMPLLAAVACPANNAEGRCWGMPPCPATAGKLSQCNGGNAKECTNECVAITDDRPYFQDGMCP